MSIENENGGTAPAEASAPETTTTNPATTENTSTSQSPNGVAPTDWRASLGEEYRENKSLANYKSLDDFAKSHLHLEKMIGQKQPSVIGSEEKTVYATDAYQYNAEEGEPAITPEIFDKVSAKAAELQISPAHFQELVNTFLGSEGEFMASSEAAKAAEFKGLEDSLRQEWGLNYEQNIDNSHKAFELFASPELKEEIKGASNRVKFEITKMMSNMYSKIGETSFGKNGGSKNNLTIDQAKAKIAEIRNDSNHPYHKGEPSARTEMANLYLAAEGKE